MNYSIGDICFSVDEALAQQQPHVLSFSSEKAPMAECTIGDSPVFPGACLFDSGLTWRLHEMNDDYAICMYRGVENHVYQTLWLSNDFLSARLSPGTSTDSEMDFGFSLDGALFQLWTNFLLMQSRGVVLHALGVKVNNEAHLFIGASGVGKSTLSQLLTDAGVGTILSDDRIIVRRYDDTFRAYGTPWNGEAAFHCADSAPVRRIYFLQQHSTCFIEAVSNADAAARLFSGCSMAGWPANSAVRFVLDFTADMAGSVSCDRFGFTPDNRAINTLEWL